MSARLPATRPAEAIRILVRNGFRLLRSTKHRTYTDDAVPPHLVTVPFILTIDSVVQKPLNPRHKAGGGASAKCVVRTSRDCRVSARDIQSHPFSIPPVGSAR